MPLVFIQLQRLTHGGTDAAAQLEGRALTTGRAAEEVGDGSDDEDDRRHLGTDGILMEHGVDELVGTPVFHHTKNPIHTNTEQTAHRQQPDEPHVLAPEVGNEVQHMVERRTHRTAQQTHHHTQQTPFQESHGMILDGLYPFTEDHAVSSRSMPSITLVPSMNSIREMVAVKAWNMPAMAERTQPRSITLSRSSSV